MFFSSNPRIFDFLPERTRREFCRPLRRRIAKSQLECPSKKWLQKAAEEFPLYQVERRSLENPTESIPAYEFDLGGAILGFNFISPDGTQTELPRFLHIAYLFRKKEGAESFKKMAKVMRLLEEGENSYPFLFVCKVGGSFFPFLEQNEAFDLRPAPKDFLFNSLKDLGFEKSKKSFGLVKNGTVLVREFQANDPSAHTLFLTLDHAMREFGKHESEFGSFLKEFREKEENE